jgi:uracil-DNA glycosylase
MRNIVNQVDKSWKPFFKNEAKQPYYTDLMLFIASERKKYQVYPSEHEVLTAFKTPLDQLKVVILGQDPYHGALQAHGLAFSVKKGVKPPPSLRNIFKELSQSVGFIPPDHGDLSTWASQGVFLLNTVLTVRENQAQSHAGHGWEILTDHVIQYISDNCTNVAFLLWGSNAHQKANLIAAHKHLILKSAHPSPLSAYRGFLGCKHFIEANNYLLSKQLTPIQWQI